MNYIQQIKTSTKHCKKSSFENLPVHI